MSIEIDTPVRTIEGIGPVYEAKLQAIRAHNVSDLLRVSAEQLYRALDLDVPLATVRAWRNRAALMHIQGVDHQVAEALHRGGIETVEELARQSLENLATRFAQAAEARIIPTVPANGQICDMIRDAATVHHCGRLAGTVLGAHGDPVAGAEVRIGDRSTMTDERGRFRLLRIPLGRAVRLVIRHPEHSAYTAESPTLAADDDTIQLRTVTLRPATDAPLRLSEYDGDRLPALTDHAVTSRYAGAAARPPHLDLLVLHDFYADRQTAKLVSKYLSYQDGVFVVSYYRIPVSELPSGAVKGSAFLVRRGRFARISLTPAKLARLKARRRVVKAFADLPVPQTLTDRDKRLADIAAFLKQDAGGTLPS